MDRPLSPYQLRRQEAARFARYAAPVSVLAVVLLVLVTARAAGF